MQKPVRSFPHVVLPALQPAGPVELRSVHIYRFTFADGSPARARNTFVHGREGGRGRITAHHSSAMPEPQ